MDEAGAGGQAGPGPQPRQESGTPPLMRREMCQGRGGEEGTGEGGENRRGGRGGTERKQREVNGL